MQLEVGDIKFRENFIVLTNLISPLIGLLILRQNSSKLNMSHGSLNIPLFSMQLKIEDWTHPIASKTILNRVKLYCNRVIKPQFG